MGWDKLASVDDNFSDVRNARRRNPITIMYRKPELGTFGIVNGTIIYISYLEGFERLSCEVQSSNAEDRYALKLPGVVGDEDCAEAQDAGNDEGVEWFYWFAAFAEGGSNTAAAH